MKRLFSAILIIAMFITLLPLTALPASAATYSGVCGENLTWTLNTDTGKLTISGTGAMTDWSSSSNAPWYSYRDNIKSVSIGNGVTTLGRYAFYECTGLTSVTVPNSVTDIGSNAFSRCERITSVTIGNSVTTLGSYAFYCCYKLTSITFGNSVTTIGFGAFETCPGLTDVTIPSSVTSLGNYAFSWCTGLTTITIPSSVKSIGSCAFIDCNKLTDVYYTGSQTKWNAINIGGDNDCLTNATIHFSSVSGTCGDNLTWTLATDTGKLMISGTGAMTDWSSSADVPWDSYRELIKTVIIGNGVSSVGDHAFYYCTGLTSVTIPNSVTSIGEEAFSICKGLTAITIPNSVTEIDYAAFRGCAGLTSMTISTGLKIIGRHAFENCTGLTDVTIPNSVTEIGGGAFESCTGLTSIIIPSSVTSIGSDAFLLCTGLKSIIVDSNNSEYDSRNNCNAIIETASNTLLTGCINTVIPNDVMVIGHAAFGNCTGLKKLIIPNSVTSIDSAAFSGCTGLTSITIPDSVTEIGSGAFFNCFGLMDITLPDSAVSIGSSAFYDTGYYNAPANWVNDVLYIGHHLILAKNTISSTYSIKDGTITVANSAFYGCSMLTAVTIPNSVKNISNYAFYGCTGLTDVYYSGTEAEWNAINIGSDNDCLTNATIHFSALSDITIYFTNDVHGAYENYAYAAEIMKDGDFIVDAGDNIQGSVAASLTDGQCMVDIMKAVGYDVAIPGNHEFDFGFDRFLEIVNGDNTPYISANVWDKVNDKSVLPAYTILEAGGRKIAFVGITTPETLTKSIPTYFQNEKGEWIYDFCNDTTGEKLYKVVQDAIDAARAEGADYVIAVGHLGVNKESEPWTSTSVIKNVRGLDALIDGHSHSTFTEVKPDKDGKYVTVAQTGTKLANVGKLTIDTQGTITAELIPVSTGENDPYDVAVAEAVAEITAEIGEIENTVVAKTEVDLTILDPDTGKRAVRSAETNLGDLCADAYRDLLKTDIAFVNGGGIRNSIAKGDVTYGNIIRVHPFSNLACAIEVTGQQIWEALELGAAAYPGESGGFLQVSGLEYTINSTIPSPVIKDETGMFAGLKEGAEHRVTNVKVGGEPLDVKKTYTLGGHNYMLKLCGDGYAMFNGCKVLQDEIAVDNEVLIRYIRDTLKGVVKASSKYANPHGEGRIRIVNESHTHSYTEVVTPPTCTEQGYTTHTCSVCGDSYIDAYTDPLGHAYVYTVDSEPTVTKSGSIKGTCVRCNATTSVSLPNLNDEDYTLTITTQPTCTTGGKITYTWNTTDYGTFSFEQDILPLGHDYVDGVCTRCGDKQEAPDVPLAFSDVNESAYYAGAVKWAVAKSITSGTSATTFSPDNGCTRAQVVAFLWRAAGQPEPTSSNNPFSDVKVGSYYYKAVLWAVEKNVTAGTSATTFSPDSTCTRAQIVTFLWRFEGMPAAASSNNPFRDVSSSAYYYNAVLWAVGKNVTSGTSATTFSPEATCTRAQVVTFLYRDMQK